MGAMETLFGVNFADGRIKGYGYKKLGTTLDKKSFSFVLSKGIATMEKIYFLTTKTELSRMSQAI